MEKGNKSGAEFLRQKAEELLKKKSAAERGKLSEVDTQKLIHELEVHQIELEMQNDELRHAWAVAEVASDKYTTLYDFSPTGYLSLSKEGKITELNLYAAQLLGKERLYLKGLRFGIFVSNDNRGAFNQFLGHIFSNKAKETCELTLLPKANSTVYVHLSGIAATKGEECLVSLIDITERTQAEMALRESEEKFKALIEGAKDGIILVTNDRSRVVMNEAFARMHGYTVDEMNNLNLKDLDTPETSRLSPARLQKILAGESMTFEAEHFCKSGQTFPVEVSANLVTIGGRTYILGFHRDISERKRIQAALQDNERQLWESQEVAHLGSFVWDISAGLWKSSAILDDILGIDDNYIRSLEGWEAIIHPEWRDTMVDFVTKEILAKHQRFDKEYSN